MKKELAERIYNASWDKLQAAESDLTMRLAVGERMQGFGDIFKDEPWLALLAAKARFEWANRILRESKE